MKKLCLMLTVVLLLTLSACGPLGYCNTSVHTQSALPNEMSSSLSSQTDEKAYATAFAEESAIVYKLFSEFIAGNISAVDKEGNPITIHSVIERYEDSSKYALYDMNGDKIPELCVKTPLYLEIFWIKDGQVSHWYHDVGYSKPLNNMAILYERPGGGPPHTDYQYRVLGYSGEVVLDISFSEYPAFEEDGVSHAALYWINDTEVTQDAYTDLAGQYLSIGDDLIVWNAIKMEDGSLIQKSISVNEALNCTVVFDNQNPTLAQELIITDKKSSTEVQRIHLPENESFTHSPVFAIDVTFDGNKDLLVPAQKTASAVYFQAYIWNENQNKFIYAPSFENLSNFSIDQETRQILSHRSASKITSYGISRYDTAKKDFILEHTLYWELEEDDQLFHFVEEKLEYSNVTIVEEITIATNNNLVLDKTKAEIAHYFVPNSLWDLNSNKWDFALPNLFN